MFLGIDRDAFGFTNGVTFGHQRKRDGVEWNLGRCLLKLVLRGRRSLLLGVPTSAAAATGLSLAWRATAWTSSTGRRGLAALCVCNGAQ
jgi:hypothetical protein